MDGYFKLKMENLLFIKTMVEEGKLNWHSTVTDIFPEIADQIDPGVKKVTLEQFLSKILIRVLESHKNLHLQVVSL